MLRQCDLSQAMRSRQCSQRAVARTTRGVFRAFAGRVPRIDMADMKRDAEHATGFHAMCLETVRRILEPVMHVQRLHLTGPSLRCSMQEHRGIGAAAVGNPQRKRCRPGRKRRSGGIFHPGQREFSALVSEKRP